MNYLNYFIEYQHESRSFPSTRYLETDEKLHLAECKMCSKVIGPGNIITLSKWVFCAKCYYTVQERLSQFIDTLLLPQDEFDKWLANND